MVTQRSIRAFRAALHTRPPPSGCAHGLGQTPTAFKGSCERSNFPADLQCSLSSLPLQSHVHRFGDTPDPAGYRPWAPYRLTEQKEGSDMC